MHVSLDVVNHIRRDSIYTKGFRGFFSEMPHLTITFGMYWIRGREQSKRAFQPQL